MKLVSPVKRDVQVVVADPAEIEKAIERFYGQDESESFADILKELGPDKDIAREVGEAGERRQRWPRTWPTKRPSSNLSTWSFRKPCRTARATSISSRLKTEFSIRYRVDGALYEMAPPPKHLALPVISRLKVMANLNISERRLPQDGRISYAHRRPAD